MEKKFISSLMGLACCDALGTTVEFMHRDSFDKLVDIIGGGPFQLQPGQWTDDTSMALCLAESLIECKGYNAFDQATRYCHWYEDGHLSSAGDCFDIGVGTRTALNKFSSSGNPYSVYQLTTPRSAGNGCMMRLTPIPLTYWKHPKHAVELAGDSARVTHGPQAAIDACKYYAALIVGCLHNASKEELLSPMYCPPGMEDYWTTHPLVSEVDEIAKGSYKSKNRSVIKSSGYIIHSMEAALWSFYNTNTFKEGAILAVNLGYDADTVGAIYGQLAGAYYGDIPSSWADVCSFTPLIHLFGEELLALSEYVDPTATNCKPVLKDTLSSKYRMMKLDFYDKVEEANKTILRRSSPCPSEYETLEAFDEDVANIKSSFSAHDDSGEEWKNVLLEGFGKEWKTLRNKLSLRIGRKI